jgi:flavin reductase (DIM6/NTAB) family NADH-FMN oxidoreductase RutF/rubredoxin
MELKIKEGAAMNKSALYSISYGLFVLSAKEGEKDSGCITNTAMQVTSEPLQLTVTINKENYTTGMIERTGKFNLSVISQGADFSLFQRFGFQSGRYVDKFDGFSNAKRSENGIFYVTESCAAFLCCTVVKTLDLGTHILFAATIGDGDVLSDEPPMTYAFYFANVKPKPRKVVSSGRVWVCRICGYIYDEAKEGVSFEDLPPEWSCPICKHPKSDFELMKQD